MEREIERESKREKERVNKKLLKFFFCTLKLNNKTWPTMNIIVSLIFNLFFFT